MDFDDLPLAVFFCVSVVAIVLASELGRWIGKRDFRPGGADLATLVGALLGLLALMIGFTFEMALSRFDARRVALLEEANSISTSALRARLLPSPYNNESLALLQEYAHIRLDVTRGPISTERMNAVILRSNAIQESLWQTAAAAKAVDSGMIPTGIFVQALNTMIDDQESRLTAVRNRVPPIVIATLYAIAIVASCLVGYVDGREPRNFRFATYVISVTVAGVLLLIVDLDRAGTGFLTVEQQPMIDTVMAIDGYVGKN